MARNKEMPKIGNIIAIFNGNSRKFDSFMEALIKEYLEQDSIHKTTEETSVQKVEIDNKTA